MTNLITGDIGGTKANLALYTYENGKCSLLKKSTYKSGEYASMEELVKGFLRGSGRMGYAAFCVAGPVVSGSARLTNLGWDVSEEKLQLALGADRVFLVNDVYATAYSIPHLSHDQLATINRGEAVDKSTIGVVAPGTGLGEAFLTWYGNGYTPHPSEGGHCDFAPRTPEEFELAAALAHRGERVDVETLCSGPGIARIYDYLKSKEDAQRLSEPPGLAQAEDRTPVIVDAALHHPGEYPVCARALQMFSSILASEAGNLALKVMATGGVYLGGGIPPKVLPILQSDGFIHSFSDKRSMSGILRKMPLRVITTEEAALIGVTAYLLDQLRAGGQC
ncbi:MAG: glucokinase [Candidatus Marsarchaeota archaeon]|nr:glucokinase [Candidatus Marsarchaeota archaeon]